VAVGRKLPFFCHRIWTRKSPYIPSNPKAPDGSFMLPLFHDALYDDWCDSASTVASENWQQRIFYEPNGTALPSNEANRQCE